jgi:hypothetical protein
MQNGMYSMYGLHVHTVVVREEKLVLVVLVLKAKPVLVVLAKVTHTIVV